MTAVAKSSSHRHGPSEPEKDSRDSQREPAPAGKPRGFWPVFWEWSDALVVAFLLAMFIRLFVVELFKIPSGSMTPTLLGSEPGGVSFFDVDGDNDEDMIVRSNHDYLVYLKENKRYRFAGQGHPGNELDRWMRRRQTRQDRIIVAKFLYWFSPPRRGDIVVFKPPEPDFDPSKPIYIKRVVGLPGETLSFEAAPGVPGYERCMGHLAANGKRVESPEFFRDQLYQYRSIGLRDRQSRPRNALYEDRGTASDLVEAHVPENGVYAFGDNTVSSRDSRYWGAVSMDRIKGRAICRYPFPGGLSTLFRYALWHSKDPGFLR